MTSTFVDAAELMAQVLGAPDFLFAVIDHPIANAGSEGIEARAQTAVAQAVAILTGEAP